MMNAPDVAAHGYVPYTKGCRCDTCRAAKADYMRLRRAEARAWAHSLIGSRFVANIRRHGTRYGYEEKGCRCRRCTRARAVSDRRYTAQARRHR